MERSESIAAIAAAIAKAQGMIAPKVMTGKGQHGQYLTIADVLDCIREPLSANEISFTQVPEFKDGEASVLTFVMHSSGEWLSSSLGVPVTGFGAQGGGRQPVSVQAIVGTMTYLKRCALTSIFGVPGEKDDDGEEAAKHTQQAPRQIQNRQQYEPPIPVNQEVVVEFKDFSSAARNGGLLLLGHGASPEMSKATAVEGKAQVVAALKHLKIDGKPSSGQWTHAIASIPKLIAERRQWDEHFATQDTLYNGYLSVYKNWKAMVAPYTTPPLTGEAVNSLQISHLTKATCDHILTMLEKDQFSGGEEESALDIEVPANPGMKVPGAFQ